MKKLLVYLAILFLISLIQYNIAFGEKRDALVLYDDLTEDYGIALVNLLGHFSFEYDTKMEHISKVSIDRIKGVDVLFVLSSYDSPKPSGVVLEAITFRNKISQKVTCLIGTPSWLKRSNKYQVFAYVSYKGQRYRGSYGIYPIEMEFTNPIAFFDDETKVFISENKNNLWIVQGFPFFGLHSWVFADVLHDILKVQHKNQKLIFLRLEDVNPSYRDTELKRLEDCINYLYSQGVPFAIAVYPVFINFEEGKVITLLQNKKLVSILKKAEKMNGSIIMHGTSHQYRIVSGEGSEFWDILEDKPLPNEKEYFHKRIQFGLWVFKKAGLTPLFFEAPHYNLPPTLQPEMRQYFKTILGNLMINNRTYKTSQSLPFIVYKSYSGLTVLPEQLGYISEEDKRGSIERIKERALEIGQIVRDPVLCFFYHPYLDGDKPLRELIPFFRDHGFRFTNIAPFGAPPLFDVKEMPTIWDIKEEESLYVGIVPAILSVISALVLLLIYIKLTSRRKRRLFEVDRSS